MCVQYTVQFCLLSFLLHKNADKRQHKIKHCSIADDEFSSVYLRTGGDYQFGPFRIS